MSENSDQWDWNVKEPDIKSAPPGTINTPPGVGEKVNNPQVPGMISIIIPIFNQSYHMMHHTGNAIGSVKANTPEPFEIILVDNGSTVGPQKPSDYQVNKYIINEENKGVAVAWNQGIRVSSGEYICLMNSDAMVFPGWSEDMLEGLKQLDFVMATPMYGEPFSRAVEALNKREKWMDKPFMESVSEFRDFACVMFKKELINEVGAFDEDFKLGYGEDLDFFDRMDVADKKYGSTKRVNIFHIIGGTSHEMPEIPKIMDENRIILEKKQTERKGEVWEPKEVTPEFGGSVTLEPVLPEPENELEENFQIIKTNETGDQVFFVKEANTHWITSPEVLQALGFDFGDIRMISRELYMKYGKGEKITMENVAEFKNAKI